MSSDFLNLFASIEADMEHETSCKAQLNYFNRIFSKMYSCSNSDSRTYDICRNMIKITEKALKSESIDTQKEVVNKIREMMPKIISCIKDEHTLLNVYSMYDEYSEGIFFKYFNELKEKFSID